MVLATFRQNVELIKEHPDYVFTASSTLFYRWVEELDPALFREIQYLVKQGRWCLAGGWLVESDCNMPCGESFIRQGLYGQRYFMEKFGRMAKFGFNIDSFGHNGMLPQILSKSGLEYYVFTKPIEPDQPLSSLFWWESPDGSRVLTFKIWGAGPLWHLS